jgi:glycosyltransferase involved in cell wall biosynthesis
MIKKPSAAPSPRIALAHDWLNQEGGAEVVLQVLHEMFPAAPIYTTIADTSRVPEAKAWDIRSTWMDRLPGIHANHQPYLPIYPLAWSSQRLEGYDLVLSNKSGFCHGLRAPGATHVCYCLTPTRYVWQPEDYLAHEAGPKAKRLLLRALLPALRRWDYAAAQRVDHFIGISSVVQARILRYYDRESEVIFPPVDIERFQPVAEPEDFHLILARLVPYKRIDLAVQAFNRLGKRLVVVGDGRDRPRLEAMAGPHIEFRGRLPQDEVDRLLARCQALIWPGIEDYGLVPVEAMASGRPVIARRAGGVLDTIVEGETGLFFGAEHREELGQVESDEALIEALVEAVGRGEAMEWSAERNRARAERFGRAAFEDQLRRSLESALENKNRSGRDPDETER